MEHQLPRHMVTYGAKKCRQYITQSPNIVRIVMKLVQERKAKRAKLAKEVKLAIEANEVRISNVTFPPKFSTNRFHQIVTSIFPPYS